MYIQHGRCEQTASVERKPVRGLYRVLVFAAAMLVPFSAVSDMMEYPYVDVVVNPEFALVGEVSPGCTDVLYKAKPAQAPQGFKIGPKEAVSLAAKAVEFDCSSRAQRIVRANKKGYMIINVTQLPSGRLAWSEVYIDGMTGKVIRTWQTRMPPDDSASAVQAAPPSPRPTH